MADLQQSIQQAWVVQKEQGGRGVERQDSEGIEAPGHTGMHTAFERKLNILGLHVHMLTFITLAQLGQQSWGCHLHGVPNKAIELSMSETLNLSLTMINPAQMPRLACTSRLCTLIHSACQRSQTSR